MSLKNFVYERLLSQDSFVHKIAVLGHIDSQPAVLLAEKTSFSDNEETLSAYLKKLRENEIIAQNDIYTWLLAQPQVENVKLTLIHPATPHHIKKYTQQTFKLVHEDTSTYNSAVLPYIKSFPPERLQWVYNILDHTAETDRIVYEDFSEDTGFIILPDLKWDGKTLASLYLQCLIRRRDIYTLRHLTSQHLPLLEKIRQNGLDAICERYTIPKDEISLLVHYQPSYYHFHVHFVHTSYKNAIVGNCHQLDDIIDMLHLEKTLRESGSYSGAGLLMDRTLTYAIGDNHGLNTLLSQIKYNVDKI